jgi:hypothetical protein
MACTVASNQSHTAMSLNSRCGPIRLVVLIRNNNNNNNDQIRDEQHQRLSLSLILLANCIVMLVYQYASLQATTTVSIDNLVRGNTWWLRSKTGEMERARMVYSFDRLDRKCQRFHQSCLCPNCGCLVPRRLNHWLHERDGRSQTTHQTRTARSEHAKTQSCVIFA